MLVHELREYMARPKPVKPQTAGGRGATTDGYGSYGQKCHLCGDRRDGPHLQTLCNRCKNGGQSL